MLRMFWQKQKKSENVEHIDEIKVLFQAKNALAERITNVEQRMLALELEADTFRNKVLRKIQVRSAPEQEEPEQLYTKGRPVKRTW
jgi:hypothetical protein